MVIYSEFNIAVFYFYLLYIAIYFLQINVRFYKLHIFLSMLYLFYHHKFTERKNTKIQKTLKWLITQISQKQILQIALLLSI